MSTHTHIYPQKELTFFACYIIQWKEFQVFNNFVLDKCLFNEPLTKKSVKSSIRSVNCQILGYLAMVPTAFRSLKAILLFSIKRSRSCWFFFCTVFPVWKLHFLASFVIKYIHKTAFCPKGCERKKCCGQLLSYAL